jgi:murein DD-endopeptidase MepM/ murein hydrolase activator NlpD
VIRHSINGRAVYSLYAHLEKSFAVHVGSNVAQNALIGHSSCSGYHCFGAHLHFSMYTAGGSGQHYAYKPEPISGYSHINNCTNYSPEGGRSKFLGTCGGYTG